MKSFNLSEWALDHRSFVVYLMLVFIISGIYYYTKLGRDEDPPVAFKGMVLEVKWPGSMINEMVLQVTDRIEKGLQEVPSLDFIKARLRPARPPYISI